MQNRRKWFMNELVWCWPIGEQSKISICEIHTIDKHQQFRIGKCQGQ
ncbi:hypothetical protein A2U01_0078350, partial [Trifolium medium]|nr:hypothetical protein [Trifolium medium]